MAYNDLCFQRLKKNMCKRYQTKGGKVKCCLAKMHWCDLYGLHALATLREESLFCIPRKKLKALPGRIPMHCLLLHSKLVPLELTVGYSATICGHDKK